MKKTLTFLTILALTVSSCKSSKQTSTSIQNSDSLNGNWELTYIKNSEKSLPELYPEKMPVMSIDTKQKHISGTNGCNNFSGSFGLKDNHLDFTQPMIATKRYCEGMGEQIFMQNLGKTQTYSISKDQKTLQFNSGDYLLMRFERK